MSVFKNYFPEQHILSSSTTVGLTFLIGVAVLPVLKFLVPKKF